MQEIKNAQEFDSIREQDTPILLDFYADWCGPCRAFLPVVEKLADKYQDDFVIRKVNVDRNPELTRQLGVRSIPTLFFIQNGEVLETLTGYQAESVLEDKIQQYLVRT